MYFCPCCGYRVFYEQPPGTYLVCPICFWEDTGETGKLRQAQLNFIKIGACHPQWLERVRCPKQDERDPNWQLLDEKIKTVGSQIIQQIRTTFEGIEREDGISLYEAREIYLIRDYAYNFSLPSPEAKELLAKANAIEIGRNWQEIPEKTLIEFIDFTTIFYYYLDPKGWRYYLPAYMICSIQRYIEHDCRHYLHQVRHMFLEEEQHLVWDRIQQAFHQPHKTEYLALITVEQQSAIKDFLQFVVDYGKD